MYMGQPLFDFDGNGRMDAIELLSAINNDSTNPLLRHNDNVNILMCEDEIDADERMDLGYLEDSEYYETGEFEDDDFSSIFNFDD